MSIQLFLDTTHLPVLDRHHRAVEYACCEAVRTHGLPMPVMANNDRGRLLLQFRPKTPPTVTDEQLTANLEKWIDVWFELEAKRVTDQVRSLKQAGTALDRVRGTLASGVDTLAKATKLVDAVQSLLGVIDKIPL